MIYEFGEQQARIHDIEGVGSIMSIFLPRTSGVIVPVAATFPQGAAPHAKSGETVLVVDDEPGIRILLVRNLRRLGYSVLEGSDGKSGLRHVQGAERIDLLVTDFSLTSTMNGWQLAEAARVLRPDLKVLFITGFDKSAVADNRLMQPGMELMKKPFTMAAFLERIESMINTARTCQD
jgi:DNA-binding NtrC family response regulator